MDTGEPRKPKFTRLTPETYQKTPYARLKHAADGIRQEILGNPSDEGRQVPELTAAQKPPGSDD